MAAAAPADAINGTCPDIAAEVNPANNPPAGVAPP